AVYPDHRDALVNRTHQRAEITSNALRLVYPWNFRQWRRIWPVTRCCGSTFLARHRRDRYRRAAAFFNGGRRRMKFNPPVYRALRSIDMDALMRAISACNVAQVAADAFLLVDMCNNLVIQIQMFPFSDAINRESAKILQRRKPLGPHPVLQAFG